MNKTYQAVVNSYKVAPTLTHTQVVQRLYRKALRSLNSWTESRELFNIEATKVREEFNSHMYLPADDARTNRLIREANERLANTSHPDPYIVPFMPGGSLFMRNPAIPLEALYPEGIPEGVSRRRLNIDMSDIPEDQPYANRVLVDSANKTYYIDK